MADAELMSKLARRQLAAEMDERRENELQPGAAAAEIESFDRAASDELKDRLHRRQDINEGKPVPSAPPPQRGIYSEFNEFSRKQIKQFEDTFNSYDSDSDGFLDFNDLKLLMEKLGAPQTHLALKEMIKQVDDDHDNRVSMREFLMIVRKAAAGDLCIDQGGMAELASLAEVDVSATGVLGARNFFQAKIERVAKGSSFEEEIKAEQESRKQMEIDRRNRKEQFLATKANFA